MFVYTLVLLHKTRSVFLDVFLIWGYLFKFKWHPQRLIKEIFDFCENVDLSDIWQLTWGYDSITSENLQKCGGQYEVKCPRNVSSTILAMFLFLKLICKYKHMWGCKRLKIMWIDAHVNQSGKYTCHKLNLDSSNPHIIVLCSPETQINGN